MTARRPGEQGRNEIGQCLPCARSGLGDQAAAVGQRLGHGQRHLLLTLARDKSFDRGRKRPVGSKSFQHAVGRITDFALPSLRGALAMFAGATARTSRLRARC